jgi:hypothetical protein
MTQHYSEADLLETYYTRPGQSMPVMMHLADCADCAARYERLERKLRALDTCDTDEKPETFWSRQRISVMHRLERRRSAVPRIAAAAALVLALGGVATWRVAERQEATPATVTPAVVETQNAIDQTDPWQSDELNEYHSMVAWESWVATSSSATGDQSL